MLNGAVANNLQCDSSGNCTYNNESATEGTENNTILSEISKQDNITNLNIDTPNATLTGDTANNVNKISLGGNYSYNIKAKELKMIGNKSEFEKHYYTAKITARAPSAITATVYITNAHLQIHNTVGTPLWDKYQFQGSLTINGDFTAKDSNIQKNVTTNTELQNFIVTGKSTITNTIFIVYSPDKNDKSINTTIKQLMMISNGGFNSDILADTAKNEAQFKIRVDTTMLEKAYDFKFLDENSTEIGAPIGGDDGVVDEVFEPKLQQEGNKLYAVRELGKGFKDLELAKVEMDLKAVNAEIDKFTNDKSSLSPTEQTKLKELQTIITNKQTEIASKSDAQVAESYNQKSGSQAGSVTFSAITAADKDLVGTTMASDLLFNNGEGAVKETIDSTAQVAEDGGQSQSITAQNMQSEIATMTRMARFSNPYTKTYYAQNTMTTSRALNGDIRSDVPLMTYYKTPTSALPNNFWANLFGGANIIGENVGDIYGLNAGYDRRFGAHFVGGFVSYAYATMKDSYIKQIAHNIQAGLYSRLVFGKNEIDLKWSAQAGITSQNRFVANSQNDADFVRAFMGLSANYGYVFKMGQGVFLKPILGLNYYFSHTPKYSEKGSSALTSNAISSTNLSVDVGVDLRAYWNENSFFYFTPKFEQYVLTQNDDFVGAFVGSPNNFRLTAKNELKTYFQGIIGVDIGVYQGLALTLSAGVKQLISGQVDSKNETYISGNLGVKYRF